MYVSRERLREWGVRFKEVVLGVGECVVLMPGGVVEGFWEECGVLEEGIWVGKGVVEI